MSKHNKKILATLIAGLTSISVLLGGAFSNPEEVINDDLKDDIHANTTTINNRKTILSKVLNLLKVIIGVPLWAVVSLIIKTLNKLLKLISLPILKYLLLFLIVFILLSLISILCIKLICPNLRLKEIITKRLIISSLVSSIVIVVANLILNNNDYEYSIVFIIGVINIVYNVFPYIYYVQKISIDSKE